METIFTKEFEDISPDERKEMKDLFTTKEEFDRLKKLILSLESEAVDDKHQALPSPQLKQRLDAVFQERYPVKKTVFLLDRNRYWYQQNLFKIAALFVLLLSFIAFWNTSLKKEAVELAEHRQMHTKETKPEGRTEANKTILEDKKEDQSFVESKPNSTTISPTFPKGERRQPAESADEISFDVLSEETAVTPLAALGSSHPDGIYMNDDKVEPSIERSADNQRKDAVAEKKFILKNNQQLLDLLTSAY